MAVYQAVFVLSRCCRNVVSMQAPGNERSFENVRQSIALSLVVASFLSILSLVLAQPILRAMRANGGTQQGIVFASSGTSVLIVLMTVLGQLIGQQVNRERLNHQFNREYLKFLSGCCAILLFGLPRLGILGVGLAQHFSKLIGVFTLS